MDWWLYQIIQWAMAHVTGLWISLFVLNVLDVAITVDILELGGYELNPIARWFIALMPSKPWFGLSILKIVCFWLLAMGALLMSHTDAALCLLGLCALYVLIIFSNFAVLTRLEDEQ